MTTRFFRRRSGLAPLCALFLACGGLFSCATAPEKTTAAPVEDLPSAPKLNYLEVQERLGIFLPADETGFREQAFDACDLGAALGELNDPLKDCHHAFYTVIQFQLSCREADQPGTVLSEADLYPLQERSLKWSLGKTAGTTRTDYQGRGTIRAISATSRRRAYLRISTGVDFLVMRANEATAIVTPPSWCAAR